MELFLSRDIADVNLKTWEFIRKIF